LRIDATRDAFGMGIEYEGGRPGWDDANNGLVGMLGSGMPETYELAVLLRYIHSAVHRFNRHLNVPIELADLLAEINLALDELSQRVDLSTGGSNFRKKAVPRSYFQYWDKVATARELVRANLLYLTLNILLS
jgi:hypothetical protein